MQTSKSFVSKSFVYCLKASLSSSSAAPVLFDYQGNVGKVTLNRPKSLNAIILDIIRMIHIESDKWNETPSLKAVIFKGSGDRAFSCGGDMLRVHQARNSPNPDDYIEPLFKEKYRLDSHLSEMKPVQIAFWDGIVMGGGIGMTAYAPIKIATEYAVFAMPEAKIGLVPDVGAGYFLPRLRNNIGFYLGMTATHLKGQELVQAGAADHFVKRENLPKLEQEIIEKTDSNITLKDLRDIVKKYEEPVDKKYQNEELINDLFGKASLEEVYNALKECNMNKEFARKTLESMDALCPLSLRVGFESLQRGKHLDLKEVLKLEWRIIARLVHGPDLSEGIRCLFIDKGSKPNWSHKSIFDVTDKEVQSKFKKLENYKELFEL